MSLIYDDDDDNNQTMVNDNDDNNNNHTQIQRSISEQRHSVNSSIKPTSSDEHTSILPVIDDEIQPPHQIKSIITRKPIAANRTKQIPKITYANKIPSLSSASFIARNGKSSSLKWSGTSSTCKYQEYILFFFLD